MNKNDIKLEYERFIQEEVDNLHSSPRNLEGNIFSKVQNDLYPSMVRILTKFGIIHLIASLITLSVCPQFGAGPFIGDHGLMHYFMRFGPVVCVALCGAFYFSGTSVAVFLLMQREEQRRLHSYSLQVYVGAGLISLSMLYALVQFAVIESIFWSAGFLGIWIVTGVFAAKICEAVFTKLELAKNF